MFKILSKKIKNKMNSPPAPTPKSRKNPPPPEYQRPLPLMGAEGGATWRSKQAYLMGAEWGRLGEPQVESMKSDAPKAWELEYEHVHGQTDGAESR